MFPWKRYTKKFKIDKAWTLYEPDLLLESWCQLLKLRCLAREIYKNEKFCMCVWFRINLENILINHAFCLTKLNGLNEEGILKNFSKRPQNEHFWSHESFVGLCFLDFQEWTRLFLNIISMVLSAFSKISKTARWIFKALTMYAW